MEGDNLGARKTENVFAIQTPVAIAIGIRGADSVSETPATVRYSRIEGTSVGKLLQLVEVERFKDLSWQTCPAGWTDPFIPVPDTPYSGWPLLTDIFPWQENGLSFFRSWPIAECMEVLEGRWKTLLAASADQRKSLFKESRDRKIDKGYPALTSLFPQKTSEVSENLGGLNVPPLPPLATLSPDAPPLPAMRYAYRSFDRQWCLPDSRLGDFLRPVLHFTYGPKQIFLTSLISDVLGTGPTSIATACIPDYHHFCGRGGKHVIPLYRDPAATKANVTNGVLALLSNAYQQQVTAEDLFCFAYAVLATPRYVTEFWEELRTPGPRLPIPKDADLFARLAAAGRELIWLHTYGERFVPEGHKQDRIPAGQAQCMVGTTTTAEDYPEKYAYDPQKEELRVGKTGLFTGVRRKVWEFSVSGLQVVDSWLGYRMKKRSGKKSSPLDDIRPASWQFDEELLQLLWVLDATIDRLPKLAGLFEELLKADLFFASDFPKPTGAERQGPKDAETVAVQAGFGF